MLAKRLTSLLLLALFPGLLRADGGQAPPKSLNRAALDRQVQTILETHGEGIQASIWIGGQTGGSWYAWKADVPRPTASAIKTAYLMELFATFPKQLDKPLPGLTEFLKDAHPAIAHFPAAQRAEIQRELAGASVRRIGEVMIGKSKASNAVYNAAANVTTAALQGPAALTKSLEARDPAFRAIQVRRYMLAARDVTGDNEATADALAAVLQALAARKIRGVELSTFAAMREVLRSTSPKETAQHFGKGGALDSDPLTRVRSGWWETPGGTLVYVVMTTQPTPGTRTRTEAGKRLAATTEKLTELATAAARTP
jgi:hypothetical protein